MVLARKSWTHSGKKRGDDLEKGREEERGLWF